MQDNEEKNVTNVEYINQGRGYRLLRCNTCSKVFDSNPIYEFTYCPFCGRRIIAYISPTITTLVKGD